MEPYRAAIHSGQPQVADRRLIHTVTTHADVSSLRGLRDARVVVEGLTSMNRFGAPAADVAELAGSADAVGVTLHLPLGTGHVEEIAGFIAAVPGVLTWFVSHVSAAELATLAQRFPEHEFRPRIGTDLWYADKGSYEGARARARRSPGRQGHARRLPQRAVAAGHLVVVSGGTSHGVAMESPSSLRRRGRGRSRSPRASSRRPPGAVPLHGVRGDAAFAEPPHMQCSLIVLPEGVAPPQVGDEVTVRMRLTTTTPDAVVVS